MWDTNLKQTVIELRRKGKTYGEIRRKVRLDIPKSTLSDWCNGILLSQLEKIKIEFAATRNSERGRLVAHATLRKRREEYLASIDKRIENLLPLIENKEVAKIAAGMLYLGEGAKKRKGSLMFGNSDPGIIRLFLFLLRHSYSIDEGKFRCVIQCRADQNIEELEKFWSQETKISPSQFNKAQIDPRTIGKPSLKLEYKGVCRIEYFNADLFLELTKIGKLFCDGPIVQR